MKKNIKEIAVKQIAQVERLLDVVGIDQADRTEPVWQEYDGNLYIEFKVYNTTFEMRTSLWGLVALMAIGVETTVAKSTNKYRGFVKYEIKIPIES